MKDRAKTAGFTLIEVLLVIGIVCILAGIAVFSYSSSKTKAFDAVALEDLRQAYSSAMAFFLDHPDSTLTQSDLKQYGFRPSPNVILSIIDGSPAGLFLLSRYNAPGARAFFSYSNDAASPGQPGQIWMAQVLPEGQVGGPHSQGPTSGPSVQGGEPGQGNSSVQANLLGKCNALAKEALRQAFHTAQSFFQSNPDGVLTKEALLSLGYVPHEGVNLTIIDGSPAKFSMSAVFNVPGATNFGVDGSGNIVPHS